MTKLEKIQKNIKSYKELNKRIESISYYSVDEFINDAQRYIKAIKEGRLIGSINHVSSSGMTRDIKYFSTEKPNSKSYYKKYYTSNYSCLFLALGYKKARNNDNYFTIKGCGMDMNFNTNYNNIHDFYYLGFITKKECDKLSQDTPNLI